MKWSRNIGRFFGIDVDVHLSFFLLLAWVALGAWNDTGTLVAALLSALFLVGVFSSVVLHELGHALTARAFGVRTRRILLLPIGGVAQLESMPRTPRVELTVALAGPAVSLVLAGLLALAADVQTALLGPAAAPLVLFTRSLSWANLMLGVFNLVPAFPMDGGRALRALLARRMPLLRATEIAVSVGKTAAVALAVAGVLWNPWLLLIAAFIWVAARAELTGLRRQELAARRAAQGWVIIDPFWGPIPPDATFGPGTRPPGPHDRGGPPPGPGAHPPSAFFVWYDPRRGPPR